MQTTPVKISDGLFQMFGKGMIKLKIENGIHIDVVSYHAPDFSSNILVSHIRSGHYEVLKTSIFGPKACNLFEKGQFTEEKIVRRVICVEGIYSFRDYDQA